MENKEMRAFVLREVFGSVLLATLHRSGLYLPEVSEAKRRQVQDDLRRRLEALAQSYTSPVSEDQHEKNIGALSDALSSSYGNWFSEGRFRWGLAQKALNLYLKHLWCLGWVDMPPHCPIDAMVMAQVDAQKSERWTRIDNRTVYQAIVQAAKLEAKGVPLAVWELHLSNRANSAL